MATGTQFPTFDYQFFDYSGVRPVLAAGYLLYTYISGTTTNQATYTDDDLTISNTNPIVLDAAGRCNIFANPALIFTFVLKTPAGVTVKTWNDAVATPLPFSGSFLPLTGGTMTGFITLHANATAALHPVSKQQMDSALAATVASVATLTTAATAAAAAATAAAAAVKPTVFVLSSATGVAVTRDIDLAVGTYSVTLITTAFKSDSGSSTYSITVTQSATVGATTVGTTFDLERVGGAGYGRKSHGTDMDVGSLVVATAATFTMAMATASIGAATAKGSMLIVAKQ